MVLLLAIVLSLFLCSPFPHPAPIVLALIVTCTYIEPFPCYLETLVSTSCLQVSPHVFRSVHTSLNTYNLSPVLSVELCSSLYCSQSAGAPACLTLGSPSLLDSSRNTRSKLPLQAPAPQPFTATFIPPPHFPFPTPGESELWRLPSP